MHFSLLFVSLAMVVAGIGANPIERPQEYYADPSNAPQQPHASQSRPNRSRIPNVEYANTSGPFVEKAGASFTDSGPWSPVRTKKWIKSHHARIHTPNVAATQNSGCTEGDCRKAQAELDCIVKDKHSGLCRPNASGGQSKDNGGVAKLDTDSAIFTPASYAGEATPL